jgi:hypothetical protein
MPHARLIAWSAVATALVMVSVRLWVRKRRRMSTDRLLVVITGCDSGVGYSTALHCHSRGLTVVAGVLNLDSSGAQDLSRIAQVCDDCALRMFLPLTNQSRRYI